MKKIFGSILFLILFCLCAITSASAQGTDQTSAIDSTKPFHTTKLNLCYSLNVSVTSDSKQGNDVLSADWLSILSARIFMDGEPDQFGGRIDATYGQHISDLVPQKTQDDLIVSITPSRTIVPEIGLRLFLEVSGETQFTRGEVDSSESNFLDPLFLYQSVFVGKRITSASEDGTTSFDLTAGVGYAWQQTITNKFVLQQNRNFVVSANSPLSDVQDAVTFQSGYCAIVDLNYENDLSQNWKLTFGAKTVALTKNELTADIANSRVTSLFSGGLQYKFINVTYNGHLVYDRDVSLSRELSQFLGFGLKLNL